MPLNIACFIAACQPSDIVLSSFGAAVANIFRPSYSQRHLAAQTAERLLMSESHCL
jgi:hypothetical protein